jgi:alpha-mannosidase
LAAEPESNRPLAPVILAGFQVLWHPELLRRADRSPGVRDLADVPNDDACVAAVPKPCYDAADDVVRRNLAGASAAVLLVDDEVGLDGPFRLADKLGLPGDAPELLREFFAVGYAYLGLGVLLRRLGRPETLDESRFWSEIRQAADAYANRSMDAARDALRAAIDVLHGVRQTAYPATVNWVDLALLPPRGAKAEILERMELAVPWNLLAAAEEAFAWDEDLRRVVRERRAEGAFELLGGTTTGRPLPLLPFESRVWEFRRAAELYAEALGRDVDSFASRTAALYPDLPQLLMKFGCRYALHAAFDGSKFPLLRGPKLHWTAADGSVVETLARTATNAGDDQSALEVFAALAETLQNDRSATMVLAHWIHAPSAWYQYLLRVQAAADLFGKFETFSDYFLHASLPDGPTRTRVDEYYAGEPSKGPPRDWIAHHRARSEFDAARSLSALAQVLTRSVESDGQADETEMEIGRTQLEPAARIGSEAARRIADVVLRDAPATPGFLVLNPCSFARRVPLELQGAPRRMRIEKPLRAFEWGETASRAIVDAPGWGFAWIPRCESDPGPSQPLAPVAKGRRLRNTLIELEVDKRTGGIRGAWSLRDGYSRLGQQIVHSAGAQMVCRTIETASVGALYGEIRSNGEIRDPLGRRILARFSQILSLWRGKQQAKLEVQLTPGPDCLADSDDDYFACRWGWPDEKSTLVACSGLSPGAHHGARVQAADFFEIREAGFSATVLSPGLADHRRIDYRLLDSILPTTPHATTHVHFTIALNHPNPRRLLQDATWPCAVLAVDRGPPRVGPVGWFAQLDSEDVFATSLAPIVGEKPGVRARLMETGGAGGRAKLRFARNADSARLTNFKGDRLYDLHEEDDAIPVDFSAHEVQQVEVFFHPA